MESPERATADTHWDAECDVLVLGFGAAGAAAAITARESGADVLAADRFDGGGATAMSGGVVYAGGGTAQQKAAGYEDTPAAMFNYLRQETGDAVRHDTLHRFCEDSAALIQWLEGLGADFTSTVPPPKTSYPKDGVYLYYSGNEPVPACAEHAKPAPRGHRTRGSWLSGRTLFNLLRQRVEALGVRVWQRSAVHRLIVDAHGAVVGAEVWRLPPGTPAEAEHRRLTAKADKLHNVFGGWADRLRAKAAALEMHAGTRLRVRARRGVVLSTGGFVFNRQMMQCYAPKYLQNLRLGTAGDDGSGIRLGQSVGGATARLDKVSAWRFINPPTAWPKGIVVAGDGRRFCNEQVYGAKLGVAMCEDHDGHAWLILDRKTRRAALREALFGGLWFFQSVPAFILMLFAPRARSIAALARRIGVPSEPLAAALGDYNTAARSGATDPLGKADDFRQPLDTPPYYALDISAGNGRFPCPAITLGGLRVDEADGQVLKADGTPVGGLYAAGRTAIGIPSNNYVSGLSIADCLWSGRRAGTAAAGTP
ncbi:MAG: FAD-binding protein [Nevskiaceae bacterium]|nr:MAG: FAD-binding protein [Nevskiaceae bacterium]TBR71439.1 MAG: FAD-binding protein [Nevskiaceae bacterium]